MKLIKTGLSVLALLLASTTVYAEHTAPVYDVDSMSTDSPPLNVPSSPDTVSSTSLSAPALSSATIDQRLARLEQQLENSGQKDLSNHLTSMQGEVQALRGQVEELSHALQELRNAQSERELHGEVEKASSKDLSEQSLSEQSMSPLPRESDDEALSSSKVLHSKESLRAGGSVAKQADRKLEAQTLGSTVSERRTQGVRLAPNEAAVKKTVLPEKAVQEAKVDIQPNLMEEQAVYQTAYNLIKVKKYNDAISSLQKMLVKYPSGQFAANAHYWLGELYSLTGESDQAASEFNVVVKHYPANPRVADAELKLGLINATLLKWPAAKVSFKKVISKYPGTTSARLAMEQLKLLKQAGH